MEAPYGVRQALRRLSFPVDTNHLPVAANFNERTHDSCKCSWYLSGFNVCSTYRSNGDRIRRPTISKTVKAILFIPRQLNSPIRRPTNLRPDNIPVKIFARQSRAGPTGAPHADPTIAPCGPVHQSTTEFRRRSCRCTKRRPCGPGTAAPASDCANPRRRCFRQSSNWSKPVKSNGNCFKKHVKEIIKLWNYFAVGTDGQSVAGRRRRGQFGLDARSWGGQVPDWQSAGLTAHN